MKKQTGRQKIIAVTSGVIIVALAICLFMLSKESRAEVYRSIRIVELDGTVTIERESIGDLAAAVNMNLMSGDRVSTEEGAYIVLRLDSDKYVMLGERGAMEIIAEGSESAGRTSIQLEAGSVLSDIRNPLGEDASFDVVTPNATMSVRGTVYEVRRTEEEGRGEVALLVYDGKVAVALPEKESILYEAGEYTKFTDDEAPEFLIEREIITEEQLDEQMLLRLRQIEAEGREIHLGMVRTSEADVKTPVPESVTRSEAALTQKAEHTPESGATAEPVTMPAATAIPGPADGALWTIAPGATVTSAPSISPTKPGETNDGESGGDVMDPEPIQTGVPALTAEPSQEPVPSVEPTEEPDLGSEPEPTEEPGSAAEPKPTEEPGKEPGSEPKPTEEPGKEPEPTEEPGSTAEPGSELKPTEEPGKEPGSTTEPGSEPKPTEEPGKEPGSTTEPGSEPKPTEEPGKEPEPTEEPGSTTEPGSEPKPTEEPGKEPEPTEEPGSTAEPGSEPKPTEEPGKEPEPTEEPGSEPKPTEEPGKEPEPTAEPRPTEGPGKEPEPTEEPSPEPTPSLTPDDEQKHTVTYCLPYVALSYNRDGTVYSDIKEIAAYSYGTCEVTEGETLEKGWPPNILSTPSGSEPGKTDFICVSWCTEENGEWDFEKDTVQKDVTLYPIWLDGDGGKYYPVIYEAPETGFYICNSVMIGAEDYEASENMGFSEPVREGYVLSGWKKISREGSLLTRFQAVWTKQGDE